MLLLLLLPRGGLFALALLAGLALVGLVHAVSNEPAADRAGGAADERAAAGVAGLVADDRAERRPARPADHRAGAGLGLSIRPAGRRTRHASTMMIFELRII